MRTAVTPTARRPLTPPFGGQQIAQTFTRPPPVGGWNSRDSLALMPQGDAITMDNFFPTETLVSLRKGFASHSTGVGSGDVQTIAEYHAGSSRKLITAGGGAIYDSTAAGAATSKATGFSENRWQTANMNGLLGLVNGTDVPQEYNGSTVSAMTISGPTIANVIGVNIFKSRSYFWEDNSQDFWYSAVNAFGGTLTQFPLSRVGTFGGNLIAMSTWTLDAGFGVDDLAVFIMSSGEVIVYRGSNPGDAADWALVGVFRIAAPLDVRGVVKLGGDLVVMTREGYMKLGGVLTEGRINIKTGNLADKISKAVIEAGRNFVANTGWQAVLYPAGNRMVFNVPVSGDTFHQHILNTVTGAWSRFTGMNAHAWGLYNDELYFGGDGDGIVYKADTGEADNSTDIMGLCETAYDYFGAPGVTKQCTALQLFGASNGSVNFGLAAQADFQSVTLSSDIYSLASLATASENIWEAITTNWEDTTIVFASSSGDIKKTWISAVAEGFAIGARLAVSLQKEFDWHAIQYMIKPGGNV